MTMTRKGWTLITTSGRLASVRNTKDGFITLNAFVSGSWSITRKADATDMNPHGIVTSSWERGEVWHNVNDAMVAAEQAAKEIGGVVMGELETSLS
jgi:hypothetical protein